ncbi:hypothetical protein Gogos_014950 [Gossypium gossypioides]|uniref:Reverse transcriptase zinc-binding domain-containing protein n=1 Tax=Gossypium gossypioides TaxID=34282 RepID=A0A7J9C0D3_GOSGO|nr:hypothetical protein [Gossypium gossypioides]
MWRDAWLPGPGKGTISGQSIDINYTLVSDLIDVNTYTWQADVVNSLFDSDQDRRVLSIPLSRFTQEDEFLWQGDNTGEYLVRSGYKWLVSNTGDGTECANTSQNNELRVFYNRIWNLKLANKIKITFWRIANNFLPTLIWFNRNSPYHEGVNQQAYGIVAFVKTYMQELDCLDSVLQEVQRPPGSIWKPPEGFKVKANLDVSFNHLTYKAAPGVLIRNGDGLIMAAGSRGGSRLFRLLVVLGCA